MRLGVHGTVLVNTAPPSRYDRVWSKSALSPLSARSFALCIVLEMVFQYDLGPLDGRELFFSLACLIEHALLLP